MSLSLTLAMTSLVWLETQPSDTPNNAAVGLTPAPWPRRYNAIAVRSHGLNSGHRPPSALRMPVVPYSAFTSFANVGLLVIKIRSTGVKRRRQEVVFNVMCIMARPRQQYFIRTWFIHSRAARDCVYTNIVT